MLIEKPKLKIFNCGAALVIIPKDKLTNNIATIDAIEKANAAWNIVENHSVIL